MITEVIGYIEDEIELLGVIESDVELEGSVFDGSVSPAPVYEGEYIAVPRTEIQTFPTEQKLMVNDFTIMEIPYAEVSNLSGTTAIIGGI